MLRFSVHAAASDLVACHCIWSRAMKINLAGPRLAGQLPRGFEDSAHVGILTFLHERLSTSYVDGHTNLVRRNVMSSGSTHSGSNEPAAVRSPFSDRVVEKLDSFRGLFRASIDGSQVQLLADLVSKQEHNEPYRN